MNTENFGDLLLVCAYKKTFFLVLFLLQFKYCINSVFPTFDSPSIITFIKFDIVLNFFSFFSLKNISTRRTEFRYLEKSFSPNLNELSYLLKSFIHLFIALSKLGLVSSYQFISFTTSYLSQNFFRY